MKASPIALLHYFTTDLAVKANLEFDPTKPVEASIEEFSAEPAIKKTGDDGNELWQIDLTVRHQAGPKRNFPYEFRIHLVGFFEYKDRSVLPEDEERIVQVNGASILYGIIREIIRANTARGPWDGIMLPTVSFFEPKPEKPEKKVPTKKKVRAKSPGRQKKNERKG